MDQVTATRGSAQAAYDQSVADLDLAKLGHTRGWASSIACCRDCGRENESQMSDLEHDSYIQILLVEDTPGETRLIKEAFHHLGKPLKIHHA
jgi:hypothetical protein